MSLLYNEEQQMLMDTANEFLLSESPVSAQRQLRDSQSELGFYPDIWQKMVEMGWSAIPFPEELGGLDFGFKGMSALFEVLGRHLAASPMLSSVVLSGSLLQQLGSKEQQVEWLQGIITGEKRLALAVDENHRSTDDLKTCAEAVDGGYLINGSKVMVFDGVAADGWLVSARSGDSSNASLFLITPDMAGVTISPQSLIDSRNNARITLTKVKVSESHLVGVEGEADQAIDQALDLGRLCLAAEMMGASESLFSMTIEYLKTRVQFDVPIGSFQALQHRASWMFVEQQLARSTLMAAMDAVSSGADNAGSLVSLAKWKVGQMADKVSAEAVQMHGGIGVTDELDVGLYLKRIRVMQAALGDADFLLERYSKL